MYKVLHRMFMQQGHKDGKKNRLFKVSMNKCSALKGLCDAIRGAERNSCVLLDALYVHC